MSTLLRVMTSIVVAVTLAACSAVVSSSDRVAMLDGACHSRLGTYTLPKTHLKLTVWERYDAKGEGDFVLEEIQFERRPDPNFSYCLDYLASATSDDAVQVLRSKKPTDEEKAENPNVRSKGTPFLQVVTSKTVDNTAIIVRKIIRAIFVGLSGNAGFTPARVKTSADDHVVAELEFNPFDPIDVADTNSRLTQLGFCVALEAFAYDTNSASPSRYCESPRKVAKSSPSISAELVANPPLLVKSEVRGLHYRPRAPYQLSIYVKGDPGSKEPWRLAKLTTVELENASPIISLGVDRAIFAQSRTAIVFDDGVLEQICIAKGSEVEGFIGIPIDIVNGLVALPSQMLQVQITTANLNEQVLTHERQAIKLQQDYIAYKLHGGPKPDLTGAQYVPLPTDEFQEVVRPDDLPDEENDFKKPVIAWNKDTADRLNNICKGVGEVAVFGDAS